MTSRPSPIAAPWPMSGRLLLSFGRSLPARRRIVKHLQTDVVAVDAEAGAALLHQQLVQRGEMQVLGRHAEVDPILAVAQKQARKVNVKRLPPSAQVDRRVKRLAP